MAATTYRLTRSQLKNRATVLVVVAVLLAAGWTAMHRGTVQPTAWQAWFFGAPITVFLLLVVADSFSRTVVSDTGIALRRPWRRRRYTWDEIADVEVFAQSAQGNSTTRVRVRPAQGKPRTLPAPLTSGMYQSSVDPEFDAKVQEIRTRWQAATASAAARV
ncbi:hypothetical protein GXW82_32035 [Streptacidiphilus sp. 4-A2]|nr:hypothetical protein [Streptacidiphilus sp. 4-A2]